MTSTAAIAYRLRIRKADDSDDQLVVTSLRGGVHPYITGDGGVQADGQSFSPLTGEVTVGACVVKIIDAITDVQNLAIVESIPFSSYANLAAMLADGWVLDDPTGLGTWTVIATPAAAPTTPSSTRIPKVTIQHAQTVGDFTRLHKTFGGLTPGATYYVTKWAYENAVSGFGEPANTWYDTAEDLPLGRTQDGTQVVVADGGGTIDVELKWYAYTTSNPTGRTLAYDGVNIATDLGSERRVVTSQLADAEARQQLLSCKAFLDESTDGGAHWDVLVPGYCTGIRFPDALVCEVDVGDSRRVDLNTELFAPGTSQSAVCLLGSAGSFASAEFVKSPVFKVTAIDSPRHIVQLTYDSGAVPPYVGPSGVQLDRDGSVPASQLPGIWIRIDDQALRFGKGPAPAQYANGFNAGGGYGWFPGLSADLLQSDGVTLIASYTPLTLPAGDVFQPGSGDLEALLIQPAPNGAIPGGSVWLGWTGTLPSVNDTFRLRIAYTTLGNIFHLQMHPVDLVTALWTGAGIPYDATAAAAVKDALGAHLLVVYRVDATAGTRPKLGDFIQTTCFMPFGFAYRVGTDGKRVLVTTRPAPSGVPSLTLGVNDLRSDKGKVFDLDERTLRNRLTVKTQSFVPWTPGAQAGKPADGLIVTPQAPVQVDFAHTGGVSQNGTPTPDWTFYGIKELVYDLPGYIATLSPSGTAIVASVDDFAKSEAMELFTRCGRGVIITEVEVLRGFAGVLGDTVLVNFAHLPVAIASQVPPAQRGGDRVVQIVAVTPTPAGPNLTLWDWGPPAAAGLTPTLTLAASSDDVNHVVVATITNVSALVAAGASVRLQYAVAASAPTAGAVAGLMDPNVATTFAFPRVDAGATVWVRAQAVAPGEQAGAWSSWASLDLTDLAAPSSLSASAGADNTQELVTFTNNDPTYPVLVSLGGVLIATLPPGSARYMFIGLTPNTSYTAGFAVRDAPPLAGVSSTATVSFTTASGAVTLSAPTDPVAFAGSVDPVTGLVTIDGTFGLEVTATAFPSQVVFEVAVETSVGSATAGTYAVAAILAAVQGQRTRFVAARVPSDGKLRFLRAKSTRAGTTDSSYTTAVSVQPWSATALQPASPTVVLSMDGSGNVTATWVGDIRTQSIKAAGSAAGTPSDATTRAATAINGRTGTTGTLVTLTAGQTGTVKLFAYSGQAGAGTESAAVIVSFTYSAGAVASVFGRTGAVVAVSGDYSFSLISGTAAATQGGTGLSSYAAGDLIYASATNTLAKLVANATSTRMFLRQVSGGAPAWDTVAAGDVTSGTLATARGGTGLGSYAKGDILYASATNVLAALALDSHDGYVLTVNAATGLPEWRVAGGGGGSVPVWVSGDPRTIPASTHTEDDEFESATLNAKWTEVVTTFASRDIHTTVPSRIFVTFDATHTGGYEITQSYAPSGAFTIAARFTTPAAANFQGVHLYAYDTNGASAGGGSGNGIRATYEFSTNLHTTTSSEDTGTWTFGRQVQQLNFSGAQLTSSEVFLILQRDGSNNWTTWWSFDGESYFSLPSYSKTFTVAKVGLGLVNSGSTKSARMTCDFFRRDWIVP